MSSDTFKGSDSGVMEEINDVDLGLQKCDIGSNQVNGVGTYNSHLGLDNSENYVVDSDKKKSGLEIDLNKVDNEKIELDLRDSVPVAVDGEDLGVHNDDGGLIDCDKKMNELDSVSNDDDCVRDSLGVMLDGIKLNCEEDDVETIVVTSGQIKRLDRVSKKERNSASTINRKIDVNDEPDIDTTVPKRKRGRPPKERHLDSDVEAKVRVNACNFTNVETVVGTSGPRVRFGKLPKKKGMATSTLKKKVDFNDYSDMEAIVAKKKRGRPSKERRLEDAVEEKVQVRSGVKKGGDVDNAGDEKDEEIVVDMSTSSVERETGGRRNGLDDSEHMECGEDTAVSAYSDKHRGKRKAEKGRRGRKRKMMESSVHDLDNGARRKNAKGTLFDDESEGDSLVLTGCRRKNKNGVLSNKITAKLKEERKKKTLKRNRGRPPKGQEKSEPLEMIDGEKQNKIGLRKIRVEALPIKVIKGSNIEDAGGQQNDAISSGGEGKEIVLELQDKKNREKKEEGMHRSTQKQLIKDRIKDMLMKAGWTIEFRPRNGKENVYDSVYVCPKGKGYWSVTLAYKILKQEVENGQADGRAVSAFVPISEDEWNSLLRVTKKQLGLKTNFKKCKEVKDQSSKAICGKKILKKKHAKEKDRSRLKNKEKLKKTNGKERKNKKRLTLLARGSKKGSDLNGEYFLPYEGQRSLLSWMIDLGIVPLGVKVITMSGKKTNVLLEGRVTKDGIHCDCCSKTFDLADFAYHSESLLDQPLQNIFLDTKTSLLQCLRDSWTKYGESMSLGFHSVDIDCDPNDDTCNMCGDGGNLICCDSCPSAIHQKCLNIQKFPSGDWNCVYCSCKFCGMVGESTVEEDKNCDTSGPVLPTCRLCEEKYHLPCVEGKNTSHDEPNSPTFCSQKCQEIFHQLEVLLGVEHQLEEGYSWTLIQHSDDNLDISSLSDANKVECNAKLAVAWSIMDECFLPIVDQRSGINMIRNVVFSCGSNIRRLNYTGFFIAILERGDEIISAASLRIHGNLLAEMPFIGTRHTYRRQGMCRRLLNAIETALSSLNVEKLVLPAIPELQQTWTSVFGFMPLEDSHKKEMTCMNMIAFPGVDMLQKPVVKPLFGVENLSSAKGKSSGTADVDTTCNLISQISNVSSHGKSDMTCELVNCQDSITIDDKDSKKDYRVTPSENASLLDHCDGSDESNKQEKFPSDCCNMASDGNSKLNEQEIGEVENITAVLETLSDPINCEMKTAHLSDVEEIVDCVLNGEVIAINQSRDQRVVNNCGTATQAMVLV